MVNHFARFIFIYGNPQVSAQCDEGISHFVLIYSINPDHILIVVVAEFRCVSDGQRRLAYAPNQEMTFVFCKAE